MHGSILEEEVQQIVRDVEEIHQCNV
jgi:hypothetical protein